MLHNAAINRAPARITRPFMGLPVDCSISPMTVGPTKPPSRPHELTSARPPASAGPLKRDDGNVKMMDWTTKNMNADTHTPSRPMTGVEYAAITRPAAITFKPPVRSCRLRDDVFAKRGSVAAPIAAAIHGVAVSTPIAKGEKCPDAPM